MAELYSVEKALDLDPYESAEGTRAHAVAEALLEGRDPECSDPELQAYCQQYVDLVHQHIGESGRLMIEPHLDGTAVVVLENEVIVTELRYAPRGVEADRDARLASAGAAALQAALRMGYKPERVRLLAHQPRVSPTPIERSCSVAELRTIEPYRWQ